MACPVCGGQRFRLKYIKRSRSGEPFAMAVCRECGLWLVNPQPTSKQLNEYYSMDYFARRDDRGYDDYLSPHVERQVKRVLELNLHDLGFFPWEKSLWQDIKSGRGNAETTAPAMLDLGAASGLVVHYFAERGWRAAGVEVAEDLARIGQKRFGVEMHIGDFLQLEFPQNYFDLITLWATLEHLPDPNAFLRKISRLLKTNGRLILTTCRADRWGFASCFGRHWRFLNVPEHLFCFKEVHLNRLLKQNSLPLLRSFTYGSGVLNKLGLKRVADYLAKRLRLGDMIALMAKKGP